MQILKPQTGDFYIYSLGLLLFENATRPVQVLPGNSIYRGICFVCFLFISLCSKVRGLNHTVTYLYFKEHAGILLRVKKLCKFFP